MILFVGLAKKILIENDLYQTTRNGRISDKGEVWLLIGGIEQKRKRETIPFNVALLILFFNGKKTYKYGEIMITIDCRLDDYSMLVNYLQMSDENIPFA